MKFSIIVPVYNVEKYLSKCIESIMNQTNQDFELLLVNDGTRDNSQKIIDEYHISSADVERILGGSATAVNTKPKENKISKYF